ncbi:MAG: DUF327 family protein [Spirochaetes bacterium]|nr:DUF327 family protein [Spirochaetota bacterium]
MINVSPANAKKEENSRVKSKIKSHNAGVNESFNSVLTDRISFEFQGSIDELLNDLKDEEKNFLTNQTLYFLNRYRSIVEKILKTIINEGYETVKLKRLRKDKADFVIVNKINEKLFNIAREITNKNNKAFNLLKTIEEIRGLILDLLY